MRHLRVSITSLIILVITSSFIHSLDLVYPQGGFEPGGVVPVLFKPEKQLFKGTLTLTKADGVFITFQSFSYDQDTWVCIAAIPSLWRPGPVGLRLDVQYADGTIGVETREVAIQARLFKEEVLILDPQNTSIRTGVDPQKTEQLRILTAILKTFDQGTPFFLGPLTIPVAKPRLTSWFGDRRTYRYTNGSTAESDHKGLDYGGSRGTPVFAGIRGRVVFASQRITTGNTVVVTWGPGLFALYYHLDSIIVPVNAWVTPQSQIGTIGSTGLATGPHLHFELQSQGIAFDPTPYFTQGLIDRDVLLLIP